MSVVAPQPFDNVELAPPPYGAVPLSETKDIYERGFEIVDDIRVSRRYNRAKNGTAA